MPLNAAPAASAKYSPPDIEFIYALPASVFLASSRYCSGWISVDPTVACFSIYASF